VPSRQTLPQADPASRVAAHTLRHTAASLAISAGANVKVVQRMLGHSSAAMTLDVYADLFDADLDSGAERLDSGWQGASRDPKEVEIVRPGSLAIRPAPAQRPADNRIAPTATGPRA